MRIFVSFASEQEDDADKIVLALRDRGHEVFFSPDNLAPAKGFNPPIEEAMRLSDLLIFLISPDSVANGAYTRTELKLAREIWPRPGDHVLPIMLVPTPFDDIPNYIKVLTILTPEGDVAAEVSAAAAKLLTKPARGKWRPSLWTASFAVLGLLSGTLSFLTYHFDGIFPKHSLDEDSSLSVLPGLCFAVLVLACNVWSGVRDYLRLLLQVILITVGWIAAYETALVVNGFVSNFVMLVGQGSSPDYVRLGYFDKLYVAGPFAGLVGGCFTAVGVWIANPKYRRLENSALTISIAALFGILLGFDPYPRHFLSEIITVLPDREYLGLFTIWQSAVMYSIVRPLARKNRS